MRTIIVSVCLLLLTLVGCQKDMPEPEVRFTVIPMSTVNTAHDMPVTIDQNNEPFNVQHHIRGNSVFVECMIQDISFRDDSDQKQGKIILYIDGEKKEEITAAAFIIKGLERGTHQVKLEVVKPNNEPYHLEKEFTVSIP
ncbi:hypothetical protein ABE096_09310 [Robertmurraya massiliosenegalensis]|uniref:hypothetical protein n=1 Tax=Robertmurraya TaxID=2837507 RepID=UPI0039A5F8CC